METTKNVLNTRAAFPLEMYVRVKFKIPTSAHVELVVGNTYFREMDSVFSTNIGVNDNDNEYLYGASGHLHTFLKEVELRPAANYACYETRADVLNAKLQDEIEKIRYKLVDTLTVIDVGDFKIELTLHGVPDSPETEELIETLENYPEEDDVVMPEDGTLNMYVELTDDNYGFYQGINSKEWLLKLRYEEDELLSKTLLRTFSDKYFEITQIGSFDIDSFDFKKAFHTEQLEAFIAYIKTVKESKDELLEAFSFTGNAATYKFR